jgi:hydroxymethylglutaryl-CoA lyase
MRWPGSVTVCEVGPRDGFQMETAFIPTDVKVRLINTLSLTGLHEIQVTSFVHPKAIPQLRDAEEVMARITRAPGVRYTALVLNERGAERAIAARADRIDVVVSTSDSHSLSNANMTTLQAMERADRVVALGRQARLDVAIGFATALGCPFEGFLPHERVEGLVARAVEEFGLSRVSIADTVGMANPMLVETLLRSLRGRFPAVSFSLHLHNTRGMGLANVIAGIDAGVTHFDASVAGLGGCPYAPGATGNIATEDLVHMLEEMGIATYVRLDALLGVAGEVQEVVGHAESAVLRAGTSRMLLGARREGQRAPESSSAE